MTVSIVDDKNPPHTSLSKKEIDCLALTKVQGHLN